jgi:hypothetical protein
MKQSTYSGVLGDLRCECAETGGHCHSAANEDQCRNGATTILYRIDMTDITGTAFCDACGDDAFGSGLFTDETGDDSIDDSDGCNA